MEPADRSEPVALYASRRRAVLTTVLALLLLAMSAFVAVGPILHPVRPLKACCLEAIAVLAFYIFGLCGLVAVRSLSIPQLIIDRDGIVANQLTLPAGRIYW